MPIADTETKRARDREYHSRPEVKARDNENARRRYANGGKEKKKAYDQVRSKLPHVAEIRGQQAKIRRVQKWGTVKLAEIRFRARDKGLDFDLEASDLVLPEVCPVFGTPFALGAGKQSGASPSVDRIDNSKGYVKGNIVVVSLRANSMKRAATVQELRQLADFYERISTKETQR